MLIIMVLMMLFRDWLWMVMNDDDDNMCVNDQYRGEAFELGSRVINRNQMVLMLMTMMPGRLAYT